MANSEHGIRIISKENGDVHEIPSFAEVQAGLNLRQRTLTPGENIAISSENVISSTYAYDDTEIKDDLATETQEREGADSELNQKIEALNGAIIYIGSISHTSKQIEASKALLDQWLEDSGKGEPKLGYCIVDSKANDWVWNGTEWVNIGYYEVATATNADTGSVKGVSGTKGMVSVNMNGEMSVNGWEDVSYVNVEASSHAFS